MDNKIIEQNGFALNSAGKVTLGGRLVASALAEQAAAGNVMANFNLADLKKTKSKGTVVDMEDELNKISPAIALLKPSLTARVPIPKKGAEGKDIKRSFVMSVVTKLNSLTKHGGKWAGRTFETVSDPSGEYLYVARGEDIKPEEAPIRNTGGAGRKREGGKTLEQALADSKAHLDGDGKLPEGAIVAHTEGGQTALAEGGEGGEPAKVEQIEGGGEQQEEAIVVKH